MNTTTMKDLVISYLSKVNRNGIDNLIEFIRTSDYLTTAECNKHHKCPRGQMMHSLEVLDFMLKNNRSGLPLDSVILVALCHDLGKARLNGNQVGDGHHPSRSISILKKCGVELTSNECAAIRNHHPKGWYKALVRASKNPLLALLHKGDCMSAFINKAGMVYRYSSIINE